MGRAWLSVLASAAWLALAPPAAAQTAGRSAELDVLVERAFASDTELGETRSLLIIRNGETLLERHASGFSPDTRQVSWSLAKSFTHALVGRLVEMGLVEGIDVPMPTPFAGDDPRAAITWREWLTMTDGLDYTEIAEPDVELPLSEQDVVQMMYGPGRFDVVGWVVENAPALHTPGERWNYSTAGYHLIARAAQDAMGTEGDPEATTAWLDANLFDPLGMDPVAEYDAAGTLLGGSLIYATARDFARLGELYLADGVWEGERFLPEGWVEFARTSPGPDDGTAVYGAGWWLMPENPEDDRFKVGGPHDVFHGGGHEGQSLWVAPSENLVVVRLGLMPNSPESWKALYALNQEIVRSFAVESLAPTTP